MRQVHLTLNNCTFKKTSDTYPTDSKLPDVIVNRISDNKYTVVKGHKICSSYTPQTKFKGWVLPVGLQQLRQVLNTCIDDFKTPKIYIGFILKMLYDNHGVKVRNMGRWLKIKPAILKSLVALTAIDEDVWVMYHQGEIRWQAAAYLGKRSIKKQKEYVLNKKTLTSADIAFTPTMGELQSLLDYIRLAGDDKQSVMADALMCYLNGQISANYLLQEIIK